MDETGIKRKIESVAFMYEAIEDYLRAIDAHVLSWEWGNESSRGRLEELAHDYPQTIFNRVLNYVEEEGFTRSKVILGYCYENGFGTARDMEKAVQCYAESMEYCNDPKLAAFLGICYYKGIYVEKDDHKAFALFQQASVKPKYAWLLAICYYEGIGCETDYQKSFELLQKVNEKNMEAVFILGECYFYGRGTEVNYEKAYSCFKRALALYGMNQHHRMQLFEFRRAQALDYLTKCQLALQNVA